MKIYGCDLSAIDSMMACIPLAYCIYKYDLEKHWPVRPPFVTEGEWAVGSGRGLQSDSFKSLSNSG
ncbi:hypothetical protein R50912_21240 [Paenibacillus sp. FSL R5-0912]|nr:hypothetical protein R50912_21240 [Paenibacillus sp. FSL R5-0912]